MKLRKSYQVRYDRDEDGWWVAQVVDVQGCHTQGRTIEQARERIREALQAWFDLEEPFAGTIVDDVKLPARVRKVVDSANKTRATAASWDERSFHESRTAIAALTGLGLSLRDAGALLGVTRQRAQKLASG